MVSTRAHSAHRNEVPTPPPAGRAGTQNRSVARDLARWLGQTAGLLRGLGSPIEEVTESAMAAAWRGATVGHHKRNPPRLGPGGRGPRAGSQDGNPSNGRGFN